jgi:ElaA protein
MDLTWHAHSFKELTNDELYELLSLRSQVFVVEQNCVYQDMDGKDQHSVHLLGKNNDGKIVAATRLFGLDKYYEGYLAIGRVITHPEYRRFGFGKALMEKSIEKIHELYGNFPIKIGAQKYLTKFYGSFGFKEIGVDYLEDGIPHCLMILE